MTKEELTGEFRAGVEEALEESDFVSADEARKIIERKISKAESEEVAEEEPSDFVDHGETGLLEQLESHGVPQDLIDACSEYVAKAGVESALDVAYADPVLARQLEENQGLLAEQKEKAQRRRDAIAESVVEGEADTPVLDATIYDDEEGV